MVAIILSNCLLTIGITAVIVGAVFLGLSMALYRWFRSGDTADSFSSVGFPLVFIGAVMIACRWIPWQAIDWRNAPVAILMIAFLVFMEETYRLKVGPDGPWPKSVLVSGIVMLLAVITLAIENR